MADLAEVLLRVLAPMQQARAAAKASAEERAAKQRIADTSANARITYGVNANQSRETVAGDNNMTRENIATMGNTSKEAIAGKNFQAGILKALINAKGATERAKTMAGVRLQTNGNDIEAARLKAAAAIAGPVLNQIVNGETPSPQYSQSIQYLLQNLPVDNSGRPDGFSQADKDALHAFAANKGVNTQAAPSGDFMEELIRDPNLAKFTQFDPASAKDLNDAIQAYTRVKMSQPKAPAPTAPSTLPGRVPSVNPAQPRAGQKQVGETVTLKDGRRMKITGIDPQGNYEGDLVP